MENHNDNGALFETYGEHSLNLLNKLFSDISEHAKWYVNSRQYPELQTHEDDAKIFQNKNLIP